MLEQVSTIIIETDNKNYSFVVNWANIQNIPKDLLTYQTLQKQHYLTESEIVELINSLLSSLIYRGEVECL